jgi:hypothetical protein
MKKTACYYLFSLCIFSSQLCEAQPTFERIYGNLDNDWGYSILEASQGGFLVSGVTTNLMNGNQDLYLLRLTDYGEVNWSADYSTPSVWDNLALSIEKADGSFAVVNKCESDTDFFALHVFEPGGENRWHKEYGLGTSVDPSSMIELQGGGLMLCGTLGFNYKAFMFHTDAEGNKLWSKTFGGNYDEGYSASGIIRTNDGGFLMVGFLNMYGSNGLYEGLTIRTDSSGNQIWKRFYENTAGGYKRVFKDVAQLPDGRFLVLGDDISGWIDYSYNPFLMCLLPNGDPDWIEYYGDNVLMTKIFEAGSETYFLSGCKGDTTLFINVDSSGTRLSSVIVHSGHESANLQMAIPVSGGNYLAVGGMTELGGLGGSDILVLKANSDGLITGNTHSSLKQGLRKMHDLYTGKITLQMPGKFVSIEIRDIMGRQYSGDIAKSGIAQVEIDPAILPAGLYLVTCKTSLGVFSDKLIIYQ